MASKCRKCLRANTNRDQICDKCRTKNRIYRDLRSNGDINGV